MLGEWSDVVDGNDLEEMAYTKRSQLWYGWMVRDSSLLAYFALLDVLHEVTVDSRPVKILAKAIKAFLNGHVSAKNLVPANIPPLRL